jgi:ABC-type transporter MlaC component
VLLAATTLSLQASSATAGAPTDALTDFFAAVNIVLDDPRTVDQPVEKLRAIRRHVDDMMDFRAAAMLALGRGWHTRSAVEQSEFVALFAELLERSFVWRVASKASLDGGVRVDYLDETVTGDVASVETAIAGRDGNPFRLGFRMVRRGERWVVRDIVLDGVSTMENYHAQFQRIVRDASWRDLVLQLRAKVGTPAGGVQVAAAAPVSAHDTPPAPASEPSPLADAPAREPLALPATTPARAVEPSPGVPASPAPEPRSVTSPTRAHIAAVTPAHDVVRPPAAPMPPAPRLWIQVGAFRSAATAGRVAEHVRGVILVGPTPAADAAPLLRVRVGPFADRAHAAVRLRELRTLGYQPFLAVAD